MTLIKSISGIRGTIGGFAGQALTPFDVIKYTAAFAQLLVLQSGRRTVVIGRDGRRSGPLIANLVSSTLNSMGVNVVDLGLSTTPTVEIAVKEESAAGGIVITASHNPQEWNALKLLDHEGEFISAEDGERLLAEAKENILHFSNIEQLGSVKVDSSYQQKHIQKILDLPLVDVDAITKADFIISVDAVNSSGGIFVPALLLALGVKRINKINCEPNGVFAHNPEPLAENLIQLCEEVVISGSDLGIAVDPDVDRLVFVSENGKLFGEEYTLVAVADFVLSSKAGNTVSNLSSTRALADITQRHGGVYTAAAVGEVNVVQKMKEVGAVIGGEGNGGVILPTLHYGRDALVGIALFLSHLAKEQVKMSELRSRYPSYQMVKNKITLPESADADVLLARLTKLYSTHTLNLEDGLKIDLPKSWVHLRKSNTEPVIRVIAEAPTLKEASELALKTENDFLSLIDNFVYDSTAKSIPG